MNADRTMEIEYADIVRINAELKRKNTRYQVRYKDKDTACIEAPGECCIMPVRHRRRYMTEDLLVSGEKGIL